jgi:hypothetical protein
MINKVVIICMGQFSGECGQFKMDVIILCNTLELFGNYILVCVNLNIVN